MHRATSSPTAPIQTLTDQPAIVCSLVEWFLKRLDDSFLKQAIVDPLPSLPFQEPQIWTWGEVIAAAVEFAAHCSAAGLKRGDRLAHLEQHIVASPSDNSPSRMAWISVVKIRAPLAPKGWPIASDPPRVFTRAGSSRSSSMQ